MDWISANVQKSHYRRRKGWAWTAATDVKITGGTARGIVLRAPAQKTVRPATDRTREAVFSRLGAGIAGACFLDLFAGTGAYGLEALSRGALGGEFVETDRRAIAFLKRNLAAVSKSLGGLEAGGECRVSTVDVLKWRSLPGVKFDLVFADPPYSWLRTHGIEVFEIAAAAMDRDAGGLLIFEMPGEHEIIAEGWELERRLGKRGRGEPSVAFFRVH